MDGAANRIDSPEELEKVDPRAVDAAMIRGLYNRVRPLIVANFGALFLLTFALWNSTETFTLLAWATALGGWTLLRFLLAKVYMRRERRLADTWRWTLAFALGSTVAGCLWGSSILFVGDLTTDNAKLVTAFLMAALSAAAIAGYTNSLLAFAGFLFPALLPYGLRLINLDGSPSPVIALFVIFWAGLLWIMAGHLNSGFREQIALSLRNRNLAERLRIERDRAEAASAAKSRFLGHMSHELRTPLNAMIGYAEMMAQRLLGPLGNEKYERYAADIADSGHHMLSMVESILDLSALEFDRLQLDVQALDLAEIVESVSSRFKETAAERGLQIGVELPDGLPPIAGDADRLRQVLATLLKNAVEQTAEDGHVSISVREPAAGWVEVTIADSGGGMTAETLAAVQVPFGAISEQDPLRRSVGTAEIGDPTTPRLNLPLAKGLVEAQGGRFAIESALGVGMSVSVTLPTAADRDAKTDATMPVVQDLQDELSKLCANIG